MRSSGDGGGGLVFRDHAGAFRGALAHLFPHVTKPDIVELLACRKALQVGADLHIQRLHVEMDCKGHVASLNVEEKNLSTLDVVIGEVKTMLRTRLGVQGKLG